MQKLTAPPFDGETAKSIAVAAIGQSGHSTKTLQTQYLADNYHLRRRRAELVAALCYGEPSNDK